MSDQPQPPEIYTPDSTLVVHSAYHSDTSVLDIVLITSPEIEYHYSAFSPAAWQEFKDSPSAGNYFKDNIKGVYPFTKTPRTTL